MTFQHDSGHRMIFLSFLFLFLLGSTVGAFPLGRLPVGSIVYWNFSNAELRQAIVSTSNRATFSPHLSRPHHFRALSSSDIPSSTSALPTQSNIDGHHDTTNDSTMANQPMIVIAIAATAGCIGILPILVLTLYRLYRMGYLAQPRSNTREVSSPLSEWSVNVNTFRRNDMRIEPFSPVPVTSTTPFDPTGRQGFGPLPPVILISHHNNTGVDTQSPSPTSPFPRDRKPRPPPLVMVSPPSLDPLATGAQAVAGPSGENSLLTVSSSLLSTSVLPKTPPPIYSETAPSHHITLAVPPVQSKRRAK